MDKQQAFYLTLKVDAKDLIDEIVAYLETTNELYDVSDSEDGCCEVSTQFTFGDDRDVFVDKYKEKLGEPVAYETCPCQAEEDEIAKYYTYNRDLVDFDDEDDEEEEERCPVYAIESEEAFDLVKYIKGLKKEYSDITFKHDITEETIYVLGRYEDLDKYELYGESEIAKIVNDISDVISSTLTTNTIRHTIETPDQVSFRIKISVPMIIEESILTENEGEEEEVEIEPNKEEYTDKGDFNGNEAQLIIKEIIELALVQGLDRDATINYVETTLLDNEDELPSSLTTSAVKDNLVEIVSALEELPDDAYGEVRTYDNTIDHYTVTEQEWEKVKKSASKNEPIEECKMREVKESVKGEEQKGGIDALRDSMNDAIEQRDYKEVEKIAKELDTAVKARYTEIQKEMATATKEGDIATIEALASEIIDLGLAVEDEDAIDLSSESDDIIEPELEGELELEGEPELEGELETETEMGSEIEQIEGDDGEMPLALPIEDEVETETEETEEVVETSEEGEEGEGLGEAVESEMFKNRKDLPTGWWEGYKEILDKHGVKYDMTGEKYTVYTGDSEVEFVFDPIENAIYSDKALDPILRKIKPTLEESVTVKMIRACIQGKNAEASDYLKQLVKESDVKRTERIVQSLKTDK